MALKALAEPECGQANALVRLGSLATSERQLGSEFGLSLQSSASSSTLRSPTQVGGTFSLGGLLAQLPVAHETATAEKWTQEFTAVRHVSGAPLGGVLQQTLSPQPATHQLHVPHPLSLLSRPCVSANPLDQVQWATESSQTGLEREDVADGQVYNDGLITDKLAQKPTLSPRGVLCEGENSEQFSDWAKLNSEALSAEDREELWSRLEREWSDMWRAESLDTLSYVNREYEFSSENPYRGIADPLAEGRRRWALGDVPGAVLCFEAAAQQQPDSAIAWQLLGQSLAENEQDPRAISALKRSITLDPASAEAHMSLATCYANESFPQQACQTLQDWLRTHDHYKHLVLEQESSGAESTSVFQHSLVDSGLQTRVSEAFLRAAREFAPAVDADVQCGLGTLLHVRAEYDRAAECFSAAVQARPESAQLWNKLGATLANGSHPDMAVSAYHRALTLAPGFIRARYNLGISCRALGAHREAAEQFVSALHHQCSGRDPTGQPGSSTRSVMSDNIWSALGMAVATLNRPDLTALVKERNLEALVSEFDISESH